MPRTTEATPGHVEAPGTGDATQTVSLAEPSPLDVEPGSMLGRFVVHAQIGAGGMGRVFRAHDPTLDRPVALKLLHHHTDGTDRLRMAREAQAMAALSHPNIVPIFDIGEVDVGGTEPAMFIAMELVEGQTLSAWFEAGVTGLDEIIEVIGGAGAGLAAAHEAGLVHRDFKPSNVIVDPSGRARVLDFGLARATDSEWSHSASGDQRDPSASHSMLGNSMTMTGTVVGTPAYMAPEQHAGKELDHRCDQYALCVVLWEAVHGLRPFMGANVEEVYAAKRSGRLHESPRPMSRALQGIFERGLAPDPDDRFESMRALLDELRAVPRPGRRRRRMLWGTGMAAGLGAGAVALWLGLQGPAGSEPCQGAAARMEGVWDAEARARVEASIRGATLAYADQTWQRVGPGLDDYAERWVQAHAAVCRATLVEHRQDEAVMDQRMRCLDDRRAHFDALVQMLAKADAAVVPRAVTAVGSLPALEACDDERSFARPPMPDDPVAREQVEEIRAEQGQVWALDLAGHYVEALELAQTLEERAVAVSHRPLVIELTVTVGRQLLEVGKFEQAAEYLRRGYFDAKAEGLDPIAARAAVSLTYVVGHKLGKYQEALDVWAKHALSALERSDDELMRADLFITMASVHRHQGHYDDALEYYERSLALHEHMENTPRSRVLLGLATTLAQTGEYEQALEYQHQALAEGKERFGSMHPSEATALSNIGVTYSKWGKPEKALEYKLQALALWRKTLEPEHPNITDAMHNLSLTYMRLGKNEEALEYQLQVLERFEAHYGPEHTYTGDSLYSIAGIHHDEGRLEQALEYYERSLAVFEVALGGEHDYVADALSGLGRARLELKDGSGAIGPLERALGIWEKHDAGRKRTALARLSLAKALVQAGEDRERARTLALEAREGYVESKGEDSDAVAGVDAWMAEAL